MSPLFCQPCTALNKNSYMADKTVKGFLTAMPTPGHRSNSLRIGVVVRASTRVGRIRLLPDRPTEITPRSHMEIAPLPQDESARLDALRRYEILDTPPEEAFDSLTRLAAQICGTPIAVVSLIDPLRQWFKSKVGVTACETSRDIAFCAHAILQRAILEVPDARADPRFATNPLVISDPFIRFYAGTPLITTEGHALGTLCVIDRVPRQLNADQREALIVLGHQVLSLLELRLRHRLLEQSMAAQKESQLIQAQLSVALDHGIDGAALLDREGRYTYMNHAHAEIYGYEAAELIGQPWTVLYSTEWKTRIIEELSPILLQQGHWRGTVPSKKKFGDDVLIELSLTLLSQQDIPGNWLLCTCRDITAEKNRNTELRDTLTAINRVLGTIELALDGTVLTANENFLHLMGYTLLEIQGQHHRLFCDPAYVASPEYAAFWAKLNRGELDAGVYRRISKSGNIVWIQASYNPVFDATGKPYKIVKFATDISAQKHAEAEQQEHQSLLSRFKYTLDQTLDCVFMFRSDTLRFIYCNQGAITQVGYSEAELFTMTAIDIKPEFSVESYLRMVRPLVDGRQLSLTFETLHRHKDGHDIPVEIALQLARIIDD